jgi:hypothetical protein
LLSIRRLVTKEVERTYIFHFSKTGIHMLQSATMSPSQNVNLVFRILGRILGKEKGIGILC